MNGTPDDKVLCYNAEELRFLSNLKRITEEKTSIHKLRSKLTDKGDKSDFSIFITQNAADDNFLFCSEKQKYFF